MKKDVHANTWKIKTETISGKKDVNSNIESQIGV
jgi:hypothetical protein